MSRPALIALAGAALAGAALAGAACSPATPQKAQKDRVMLSNEAQADQLVNQVQRLRGLAVAPLGSEGQVAHGTLMFKHVPGEERLIAAILIAHDPSWNKLGDAFAANYRKARAALSDPAIGGRFDTGGGRWIFDEQSGKTYLYAAFPLDEPAANVSAQIDSMARIAPAWEMRWLTEVARIAHGKRPAPQRPVTLEADPYAGQL